MEITQESIGKKVMTPNGIGKIVGRVIEFGAVTKVLVDFAWLVPEKPRSTFAYPLSAVRAVENGELIQASPIS